LIVLAVFATSCTPAAAPAPAGGAPAAAPSGGKLIKIATQSPLSGGSAAVGEGIKNGAQLAVEQLSEGLKGMGFTVQIVPFDDQAKPEVGVANAKNIISDPDILGVVGHYNSGANPVVRGISQRKPGERFARQHQPQSHRPPAGRGQPRVRPR
jgi:branched-chain amino acid transport system substrate-binding protein